MKNHANMRIFDVIWGKFVVQEKQNILKDHLPEKLGSNKLFEPINDHQND